MARPSNDPRDEPVKIDSAGDALLALRYIPTIYAGKVITVKYMELLVSSKILSLASPVFAERFSRQAMQSNSTPQSEITGLTRLDLPADDYLSMELLCRLLHHKYGVHESRFPVRQLFDNLVILYHKY